MCNGGGLYDIKVHSFLQFLFKVCEGKSHESRKTKSFFFFFAICIICEVERCVRVYRANFRVCHFIITIIIMIVCRMQGRVKINFVFSALEKIK